MSLLSHERTTKRRQQLSPLLPPSSSEPVSDSFKAAARNAFPQLYSLPSHIAPWVWSHYLTRPRNLSQLCQVASPRRFVASLKLCLGLRIAAGRTSGRAWDFSWQFVESELPGKKESMECSAAGEREIPCSRVIYFRFPPRTRKQEHDDQRDQCYLRGVQGKCCISSTVPGF